MTKKVMFVFLSCFILLGLIVSCDPQTLNPDQRGSLEVSFNRFNTRSFYSPDIDMTVDHYALTGDGPSEATFPSITSDGVEPVSIIDLIAGTWTITATAYNADDIAIGDGVEQVVITAAHTTETTILVEEYDGGGTLSFTVAWPLSSNLVDPHATFTLTRNGAPSSSTLVATVDATACTATYSGALPVGSYSLAVNLRDGDVSYNGPIHTIRIVKDAITDGTYTFDRLSTNPTEGNVRVSVVDGIEDPFVVTLSRRAEQVAEGRYTKFTATVPETVDCEFAWYVDGVKLSYTGNVAYIGGDLPLGYHYIDVLASTQGLLTSASSNLNVVDAGEDEYITFLLKGTDSPDQKPYYACFTSGPSGDWSSMGFPGVMDGSVYAAKMNASTPDNQGTVIVASDESMDAAGFSFETTDPLGMLFLTQSTAGDFPAEAFPFESNALSPGVVLQFRDGSDPEHIVLLRYPSNGYNNATLAVNLNSYGAVGDRLIGSCVVDSAELGTSSVSKGNYRMECSFNVRRSADIEFYTLSYDANGAQGSVPESYEAPENTEYQVGDGGSLAYAGHTFIAWNTASDGTGTSYLPYSSFIMPDYDVTLYAIWGEQDPR